MVVEARDSLSLGEGFDSDALESMPLTDDEVMPDGDDAAAPFDGDASEAAASADDDGTVEDDPQTELRAQLSEELRPTIEAELQARFEQDKRNLQRTLNQQITQLRRQTQQYQAREQARQTWLEQYFEANGLDTRDLAVLDNSISHAERAIEQQAQQTAQGFMATAQSLIQRHSQVLNEMARDGDAQLFDPKDPEIQSFFEQNLALSKRHFDEEGGRPGSPIDQLLTQRFGQLREMMRVKREQGLKESDARRRQEASARARATKAKAAARGPQNLSRGTGGSAPLTFKDYKAQAQKQMGEHADPSEVYARALVLRDNATAQ